MHHDDRVALARLEIVGADAVGQYPVADLWTNIDADAHRTPAAAGKPSRVRARSNASSGSVTST